MIGYHRLGEDSNWYERRGRWSYQHFFRTALEVSSVTNKPGDQRDLAAEIHSLPESRRQQIFRIRREIAEGVYDTPDKLEIAVERMIDRVLGSYSAE